MGLYADKFRPEDGEYVCHIDPTKPGQVEIAKALIKNLASRGVAPTVDYWNGCEVTLSISRSDFFAYQHNRAAETGPIEEPLNFDTWLAKETEKAVGKVGVIQVEPAGDKGSEASAPKATQAPERKN